MKAPFPLGGTFSENFGFAQLDAFNGLKIGNEVVDNGGTELSKDAYSVYSANGFFSPGKFPIRIPNIITKEEATVDGQLMLQNGELYRDGDTIKIYIKES